ncbi:MAG: hypothetical protein Q8Q09_22270 [Deltaproteobacteria bacterium]|nr:hypothetical protein [Deltaproteobacteria bacterium]
MSISLHDHLRSTLDELAASDIAMTAPGASLLVQQYGDALRAGITVPTALRKRLHSANLETLRALAEEAEHDVEPAPSSVDPFDDPTVEFVLRARDQLESVLVGLRRIALVHGLVSDEFDPIYSLAQALARFDEQASKHLARNRVEQLIAERMSFQAGDGWLARYPHRDAVVDRPEVTLHAETFRPTSEQLTHWATQGVGAHRIEAWAKDDEATLEATALLEALDAERVPLSLNALRWSRAQKRLAQIEWAARPKASLAAATGTIHDATQTRTIDLGQLGDTRAVGRLIVTAAKTTLRVRAERSAVRSVQFGDRTTSEPDARDLWSVDLDAPHGPVELVVTSANGESFRCTIVIGPALEE